MSIITREKAKELLSILKAYSEGKVIQHKESDKWVDADEYAFHDKPKNYRIKPEPTYRPFNSVEECWEEMQKHQPFGWLKVITCMRHITKVGHNAIVLENQEKEWNYEEMFNGFTFADGSIFGIENEG